MSKKNNTPLGIFMEAIGLYFSNFTKFVRYMTFPVLGQIAGLLLVFLITYLYTKNLPPLIDKFSSLNNFNLLVLLSILITLPGLAIFVKAFWDYLVAYGAVNSMYENMQKSGRVYDFGAHTELIKRRTMPFIGLWFLFGIFSALSLCPLFWIICGILAIYFVLVFQVFTFEPALSPAGCVKRSLMLVKGHFASTFMLMALAGALTYIFIPQLFIKIFDLSGVNDFLAKGLIPVISQLPMPDLTQYGIKSPTEYDVAIFTIKVFAAQILIQYTLPVRSILWSMWYKELSGGGKYTGGKYTDNETKSSGRKSKSKKRPSERLMEESHKKYGKKKLDRNILRRAAEKDDEI